MIKNNPISFEGQLGKFAEIKKEQAEAKIERLKLKKTKDDSFDKAGKTYSKTVYGTMAEANKHSENANAHFQLGNDIYKFNNKLSKQNKKDAIKKAKEAANQEKQDANRIFEQTKYQTDRVSNVLLNIATTSDIQVKEAEGELSGVQGITAHLLAAKHKISDNLSETTKEALDNTVTDALRQTIGLEKQFENIIDEKTESAALNRLTALNTIETTGNESKATLKSKNKQIENVKKEALKQCEKDAKERLKSNKELLAKYAQRGIDEATIAYKMNQEMYAQRLETAIINVKALVNPGKGLPSLASRAVGMGKVGEGCTATLVNVITRSLVLPDYIIGLESKLGALNAADTILEKGSANQKAAIAASLEIAAETIVNRTDKLEVLEKIAELDTKIDALNGKGIVEVL